jgi:TPR repeat protein
MDNSSLPPVVLQAAEEGNATAQCAVGLNYFLKADPKSEAHPEVDSGNGYCEWGVSWDKEALAEALKWLTLSAEQGFAEGQFQLAEAYRDLVDAIDETIDNNMFYTDHTYNWYELIEDYGFEDVYDYFKLACQWYRAAIKSRYRGAKKALMELEENRYYQYEEEDAKDYQDELQYEAEEGKYHGEI